MDRNKLSDEIARLTKKVEMTTDMYSQVMKSYYTALLFIAIIVLTIVILSTMSQYTTDHMRTAIVYYIYPILLIDDMIALYYKQKRQKELIYIYKEGYDALTFMVESMDWDVLRKRFNNKSTPRQNAAINNFVRVTQQRWSPCRQGLKFHKILSIFNILALLLCILSTMEVVLAKYGINL